MSAGGEVERVAATLAGRAPGYLAGAWRPPQGVGSALLRVLAHDVALIEQGLARTPEVHELGLLDTLGVTLLPPRAARVPLAFTLSADAPVDVALPAGAEVAAVTPMTLPAALAQASDEASPPAAEPVIFATDDAITLTRARLAAVSSVSPAVDAARDHTAELAAGLRLFDDLEQIDHELYIGHGTLFDLPGTAEVSLMVGVAGRPSATPRLRWEYLTADGWLPFEPVVDQTHGLATDGEVLLRQVCGPPTVKGAVEGVESFWIRARVVAPLPPSGVDARLPVLDTLRARVSISHGGLPLDAALADGQPIDTSKDFLPFGMQPTLGSTFLLACDEAFKRPGATVAVEVRPSDDSSADSTDVELSWEYSTGLGTWGELAAPEGERLTKGDAHSVSLERPNDWRPAPVNGAEHHWMRVRISKGGYGGPSVVGLHDGVLTLSDPAKPPVLAGMTASYAYRSAPAVPDRCLTRNRFTISDHTEACRWGRDPFAPFRPVEDHQPAVYLGFDGPLPLGLVSLYVGTPPSPEAPGLTAFTWEYRSPDGWAELAVHDETAGFRHSGVIQFVGQPDHVEDSGPRQPLRWIRARLKAATATPEPLPLELLYHNAVWARHRQRVQGEILGHSDGSARLTLRLQHTPVLNANTVEVQEWTGTGREWESMFADVPGLRYNRDALGTVTGVWVAWHQRPNLSRSGPQDRHYILDPARGLLQFGDGALGMVPPPGAVVSVSYDFPGGPQGNVAAGVLTQPYAALPYVEAVTNPVAASGGASGEPEAAVRRRGRQRLRHLDRAVAAADFEWLALEASAEVAVARCLPLTGPDGAGFRGWVTVVIAPWSIVPQPQPSPELVRRVRSHVGDHATAAIAGQLRVIGPTYQPVAVTADVVVGDPSQAAAIEETIRRVLDALLHPLSGGPDGTGWRFGEAVHLSQIALVVERTPGVDHATDIQLTSDGQVWGDRVEIPPDRIAAAGRHLLHLRLGGS